MYKLIVSIALVSITLSLFAQSNSAIVEYESTDKGILIPRMTSNQWVSIVNPAEGLMVYDTELHTFMYFNGSSWQQFSAGLIGPKGDTLSLIHISEPTRPY